jgi:hypothetical protein
MYSAETRRRWWHRGTSGVEPARLHSNDLALPDEPEPPSIRPPRRVHDAEDDVRGWVRELRGGFDAGSGDTFDDRLDGVRVNWHKQDSDNHDAYLSALGARIADSKQLVAESEATVAESSKYRELTWQDYVAARLRLGGELPIDTPEPTSEGIEYGPNYREPDLLPGRSRFEPLM